MAQDSQALSRVMGKAMKLAKEYRRLTGKPLGITGEVGEYWASNLLNLKLMNARQPGYDAVGKDGRRIQIKSRCVPEGAKPGQRLGGVRFNHEWDTVMLILMDEDYNPIEIYEALRKDIQKALRSGGKAEKERGAMGVRKFKSIGKNIWP